MKKKLIVILLLLGCIPLILASFYFYNQMYDEVIAENQRVILNALETVQLEVQHYLDSHMAIIKALSLSPSMISLDADNGRPILVKAAKLYPDLSVVVDDPTGKQRFRGDNQSLANSGSRQFFKDAISGKDAISDVLISNTNNQAITVLAHL
ncbi:MAG: methyl-accepting chemotaxis sensory transducer with Cache sensor [Firmicutes bacterium]|nr:methyl-accepting chemotaxis sensory transducer with Cache sensor [Bacillota bacterium]